MVDRSIRGSALIWRKSSASGDTEGSEDCVEVAATGRSVLVRDSHAPAAGVLEFDFAQWRGLLGRIADGELECR
ncbi:DUF397 domain-containing protein [Spirillospora sp. CA-255316]